MGARAGYATKQLSESKKLSGRCACVDQHESAVRTNSARVVAHARVTLAVQKAEKDRGRKGLRVAAECDRQ